jgi:hypothetical protein
MPNKNSLFLYIVIQKPLILIAKEIPYGVACLLTSLSKCTAKRFINWTILEASYINQDVINL